MKENENLKNYGIVNEKVFHIQISKNQLRVLQKEGLISPIQRKSL